MSAALFGVGLALCLTVESALAAPGDLDETLGGGGAVVTPIGFASDNLRATVIQLDGKIVAVGYANMGNGNDDFVVVRYNTDGTLDTTFDTDGKLTMTVATAYLPR